MLNIVTLYVNPPADSSETVMAIIVVGIIVLFVSIGYYFRQRFYAKRDEYEKIRSIGLVNGKDVVERMLKENGISGVEVVGKDGAMERFNYKPRRGRITMTSFAFYGSGLYEVVRAARCGAYAIQRHQSYRGINLFLFFQPIVEVLTLIVPILMFLCLLFTRVLIADGDPSLGLCLMLVVYLVPIFMALLMRPIEKYASDIACRWLMENGVVAEEHRTEMEKMARMSTNYQIVGTLCTIVVLLTTRRAWRDPQ